MGEDYIVAELEMGMRVDAMLEEDHEAATGKITAGELSDAEAQELKAAAERHMVKVDPKQPSCCIDGRPCVHTMAGTTIAEAPTTSRPSVAGGALVTAYAAAELSGWFGNDDGDAASRLERINNLLEAGGIVTGNHCDENAVAQGFENPETKAGATGCGADDRLPEILNKVYDRPAAIAKLVGGLMGDEYDETKLHFTAQADVAAKVADWDPRTVVNTIVTTDDKKNRIEVLSSPHNLPNHGHAEIAVLFNYKEDTTLDRDSFVAETGRQMFVVDMWYIDKIARTLANGPDAEVVYKQLKHAMVAYQAATYLTLCDGSQRVVTTK